MKKSRNWNRLSGEETVRMVNLWKDEAKLKLELSKVREEIQKIVTATDRSLL